MLLHVVDVARSMSCRRVDVWTAEANGPARKLYESVGMALTGRSEPGRRRMQLQYLMRLKHDSWRPLFVRLDRVSHFLVSSRKPFKAQTQPRRPCRIKPSPRSERRPRRADDVAALRLCRYADRVRLR